MTAITQAYAHSGLCLTRYSCGPKVRNFVCQLPKPDIRIFPTLVPQHATEATIFRLGPSTLTAVLALADGETL